MEEFGSWGCGGVGMMMFVCFGCTGMAGLVWQGGMFAGISSLELGNLGVADWRGGKLGSGHGMGCVAFGTRW